MNIRDRIKELRRVPAAQLRPNPRNWRTHPTAQRDAIRGLLAEVGFAGAALARELPDGSLLLIDGHARAEEVSGDTPVPVLVLDVTAEEADKLLATYDPLGALAGVDDARLQSLLAEVTTESPAVRDMLDQLAGLSATGPTAPGEANQEVPERFQVLVECDTEQTQVALLDRLTREGLRCRALVS